MLINYAMTRIEITRAEAKAAAEFKSDAYLKLAEIRKEFPDYTVYVIPKREIQKKENKEAYRGLTYQYMEAYIKYRRDEEGKAEYDDMQMKAKCHSIRYPAIKQWFLNRYPEIVEFGMDAEAVPSAPIAA